MNFPALFRPFLLFAFMLISTTSFAQTNAEKIQAKWLVEKFEIEKESPQAIRAQQELTGVVLNFASDELTISRKNDAGEMVIKKGPYVISGDTITLGKDQAIILLLSEKQLTIQIPNQGILYLNKSL